MKKQATFLLALLIAAVLAACSTPAPATEDSGAVLTKAAGTAAARLTEQAASQPSATPEPTKAPTETPVPATATQAATPTMTATTGPTSTVPPASTATKAVLDAASFVADVTYPDNTVVAPGASFEKIWKIKNTGKTTWTTNYRLVCIDAGKFTCPEQTPLPVEVKPGDTVDIKVTLKAPSTDGTHKAYFRLRNADGRYYKMDGSGDLWVQIVVGTPPSATPDTSAPTNTPEATATP